jgi:hypothetical protein
MHDWYDGTIILEENPNIDYSFFKWYEEKMEDKYEKKKIWISKM